MALLKCVFVFVCRGCGASIQQHCGLQGGPGRPRRGQVWMRGRPVYQTGPHLQWCQRVSERAGWECLRLWWGYVHSWLAGRCEWTLCSPAHFVTVRSAYQLLPLRPPYIIQIPGILPQSIRASGVAGPTNKCTQNPKCLGRGFGCSPQQDTVAEPLHRDFGGKAPWKPHFSAISGT